MKIISWLIILSLITLLTGCVKRQAAVRLVYVPAPPQPARSSPPNEKRSSIIVIQEPPPSQPVEPAPKRQEAQIPPPLQRMPLPRPPVVLTEPNATAEPNHESPAPPANNAPQLVPQGSAQQQAVLQQRVRSLTRAIQQRINRLSRLNLSTADRKALQDAGGFLTQADDAIKQGDLQQSLNLTQKANLLVSAVEGRH